MLHFGGGVAWGTAYPEVCVPADPSDPDPRDFQGWWFLESSCGLHGPFDTEMEARMYRRNALKDYVLYRMLVSQPHYPDRRPKKVVGYSDRVIFCG
jgi:hypothetical protein